MLSLRAEHSGAIDILLILYALQICMWGQYDPSQYHVFIWIDNVEVLARGGMKNYGDAVKSRLELDYNVWIVMEMLQEKLNSNYNRKNWIHILIHKNTNQA